MGWKNEEDRKEWLREAVKKVRKEGEERKQVREGRGVTQGKEKEG